MGPAWVLALFALTGLAESPGRRVVVMDDTHLLRPGDWSFAEVPVDTVNSLVHSSFQVLSRDNRVRLLLVRPAELDRYRRERRAQLLISTPFDSAGRLAYLARQPGQLVLIVESAEAGRPEAAHVRLRIELERNRQASLLSPLRRWLAISTSLALFFTLLVISYRRLKPLLKALDQQPSEDRTQVQ